MKVLCVMLANGRQAMVDRAVRSFHAQTYADKVLVVLDSGDPHVVLESDEMVKHITTESRGRSIGELRNVANALAIPLDCEIIAHFDSDDVSHPERLTEQVAFLQASGKQAVGYREVLFWRTPDAPPAMGEAPGDYAGEQGAWIYSNANPAMCIGASLCYWRATWLKRQFPHLMTAEDHLWWLNIKSAGASALVDNPRMICGLHSGNTASKIDASRKEWRRVPAFDAHCREVMAL